MNIPNWHPKPNPDQTGTGFTSASEINDLKKVQALVEILWQASVLPVAIEAL